jgi:hypothetical protein
VLGTLSNQKRLDWRSLARPNQTCTNLRCTGLSDAQAGAPCEQAALGKNSARRGYNSPDCPMSQPCPRPMVDFTIEPTVDFATSVRTIRRSETVRKTQQQSEGRTGLSGVPLDYPVRNRGWWMQQSTLPEKEGNRALFTVRWCTGLSGAPTDRRQPKPSK